MAEKSGSKGGSGKKGKGIPSIPKEIKEGIEKQALRIHEEKFSGMSWGARMALSVLADGVSAILGLIPIPGLGVLVALLVSFLGKALWGNTGWLNIWEAVVQFALPFWIGGVFTAVVPTLTVAGFVEKPRGKKTRRRGTKKYRVRPGVKEFFNNPRSLAEKKISKVKKFFSRFRIRPSVKRKFKKIDTWLKRAGRILLKFLRRLIKRVARLSKRFLFWLWRTLRRTPKKLFRIFKGIFWDIPKNEKDP